jgi:hypothetical protein
VNFIVSIILLLLSIFYIGCGQDKPVSISDDYSEPLVQEDIATPTPEPTRGIDIGSEGIIVIKQGNTYYSMYKHSQNLHPLFDLDRNESRRLSWSPNGAWAMYRISGWTIASKDGFHVKYAWLSRMIVIDVSTGVQSIEVDITDRAPLSWSYDGTQILATRDSTALQIDPKTGETKTLFTNPEIASNTSRIINSPDGEYFLIENQVDDPFCYECYSRIILVDSFGNTIKEVANTGSLGSFSIDGRYASLSRSLDTCSDQFATVLLSRPENIKFIDGSGHHWSHLDNSIAFYQSCPGEGLFIYDQVTPPKKILHLPNRRSSFRSPHWSPGENKLVFDIINGARTNLEIDERKVFMINSDGSNLIELSEGEVIGWFVNKALPEL